MDSDECVSFNFLRTWSTTCVGAKDICRRAGHKKRFHEHADWAKIILLRLAERRLLESDGAGKYRIKPLHKSGPDERRISPELAKILSGNGVADECATDEYYELL